MPTSADTREKAKSIRDVIQYVEKFSGALVVIHIGNDVTDSPMFSSHIHDISLLRKAGLRVAIVPGADRRIDSLLSAANVKWTRKNSLRVTNEGAMDIVQTAALDVSNAVMTALASNSLTGVTGNWTRARGIGSRGGVDYGSAGEIESVAADSARAAMDCGFIPIFPCIGWSAAGKPYNIQSVSLASEIAARLSAQKLFFISMGAKISRETFSIPEGASVDEEGCASAMSLDELSRFRAANPCLRGTNMERLLEAAREACSRGVSRAHIIDGGVDGALPCEIFSSLGIGTMIYSSGYGSVRAMSREDVPSVLSLMRPFVESGCLLERGAAQILSRLDDYVVYEVDGAIRACAALRLYEGGQAEILAVAVDKRFSSAGIGETLMETLTERARRAKAGSVFVLTTQAADWFERLGFAPAEISSLPKERRDLWSPERGSKAYRLPLTR